MSEEKVYMYIIYVYIYTCFFLLKGNIHQPWTGDRGVGVGAGGGVAELQGTVQLIVNNDRFIFVSRASVPSSALSLCQLLPTLEGRSPYV